MGHARPSLENSSVRNVPSVKTPKERERTKKDKARWAQRGGEAESLSKEDSGLWIQGSTSPLRLQPMFLYNTSRAECSEAGVRPSGAVHGSRIRDVRVFAPWYLVEHGLDSGEGRVFLSAHSPCRSGSGTGALHGR